MPLGLCWADLVARTAAQLIDVVVSNFEFVCLSDDLLVVGQQFVRRVLRIERFKVLINLTEVQGKKLWLDKFQNGERHFEKEFGAVSKDVIPNAYAQALGKAVQEARLEPLVDPQ